MKKNLVKELILHEQIDILYMQETQINYNIDHNLLSFPGYTIETETNTSTSRTAIYKKITSSICINKTLVSVIQYLVVLLEW